MSAEKVVSHAATTQRARDIRYLTIEPGRISLHGVSLTDAEYRTLRAIAERMKHPPTGKPLAEQIIEAQREYMES